MNISDFTRDITSDAIAGLLDKPIGRDKELNLILNYLTMEEKSNVLIIGPSGSGKTNLVEGIAYMIGNNEVRENYPKNKVLELNITALNSGATYVGQFEERVTIFLEYIKANPGIVVFIDEIHMLMGFGKSGNSGASRDFSQIIKPMLARGEICVIGATTNNEFNNYISEDSAFVRRFQKLELSNIEKHYVKKILLKHSIRVKYKNSIELDDVTLNNIIDLSEEIFPERNQPDKSLDIFKRTIANILNDNNNNNLNSNGSISKYLTLIEKQLTGLKRGNLETVVKDAKMWLGINNDKICIVSLGIDELKQKLNADR